LERDVIALAFQQSDGAARDALGVAAVVVRRTELFLRE